MQESKDIECDEWFLEWDPVNLDLMRDEDWRKTNYVKKLQKGETYIAYYTFHPDF